MPKLAFLKRENGVVLALKLNMLLLLTLTQRNKKLQNGTCVGF